ncbi:MAG: hypothetical protein ACRC0J_19395, partial [Shewanella oncorhynchi]
KYVELVALPDKEALTTASAIFARWICRFGAPLELVTDGGKEFTAHLAKNLYTLMGIDHLTTSPRHPQCNSQAEVVNKTIAKYLQSVVNETTLDWELYLAPLMFSYNTSLHKSINTTPFFLTFGMEPRAPHFPQPDLRRHFYGENDTDEMYHRLLKARQIAQEANENAREAYTFQHDKKVKPLRYHVGQQVLLDEYAYLHKNRKLAPKFSGPHIVTRLIHDTNVELKLANNRKSVVHVNRLKPYLFGDDIFDEVPLPQFGTKNNPPANGAGVLVTNSPPPSIHSDNDNDVINPNELIPYPALPLPPVIPPQPAPRRGRPRKIFRPQEGLPPLPPQNFPEDILLPVEQAQPPEPQQQQPIPQPRFVKPVAPKDFFAAVEKLPQSEQRLTRAQARQLLNTIGEQTFTTQPFYQVIKIKTKKFKKKKKNDSGRSRFNTQEKNFRKTGDILGHTVSIPYAGDWGAMYDQGSSDSGSDVEQ